MSKSNDKVHQLELENQALRSELMRLRGALHMLRSHAQAAHDYYIKKAKGECRGMAPVRRTNLFQSMSLSDLKALLREIDYALDNGRKGEGVACTES